MAGTYEPLNTLKPLGENIWLVDGPRISFYGMPFPTRMTVIRLVNGDLLLHSPSAYSPELAAGLRELGTIRHLISPNWIHYAYIADWADACPGSISWASPNVGKRALKKGNRVQFDHDLGETAEVAWRDEVDQLIVHGSKIHTEVVFFHRASKTLILTDLIENFEPKKVPFWFRPIAKIANIADPDGQMPRDMRMTFRKGRDQLRRAVETMIGWGPDRIILAHGRWYEENAEAELRRAFRFVLDR